MCPLLLPLLAPLVRLHVIVIIPILHVHSTSERVQQLLQRLYRVFLHVGKQS